MVRPYDITQHTDHALTLTCIAGSLDMSARDTVGERSPSGAHRHHASGCIAVLPAGHAEADEVGCTFPIVDPRDTVPRGPEVTGMPAPGAGNHDPGE